MQTVAQLLSGYEDEPNHGDGSGGFGRQAEIDRHLDTAGLKAESIPVAGRVVVLSVLPDPSAGEDVTDVTDRVHADNCDLAVTAAACLELEIASVQFIQCGYHTVAR